MRCARIEAGRGAMTITYPLLVNALIAGLLMGGFYAALSVGATIAFGLLDIVNIAHPTFAVIGAYAVLVLNHTFHIDPILCGLLLAPVFYCAGMLLYQVYHYFFERRGDDAMRGLAFFFGLMFIAEVALIMLFGVDFRYVQAPYITTTWNFGAIALPLRLAVPFAGSLLMLLVLELLLQKTFIGRAIVAVAQDPFALQLVAVSPVRIKRIAFGIACASAALAGAFIIVIEPLQPAVGREFIGRVFAICVFGGLGSLPGTIVAAVSLGLVENLSTIFIGASWSPAVAFGVLLATLAWRPSGLFGRS
jgi:branched-chain amino acid transport system permease protein